MFFILSKILEFVINPLVWVLVLLLLALLAKKDAKRKVYLRYGIGIFVFLSIDFLSLWAIEAWEVRPVPIAEIKPHKVAIVLGGFTVMETEPHDRTHTNAEADRLLHAIQLFKVHKVDYILVTGGTASLWKQQGTEAEMAERIMLLSGVPKDRILVENQSRNTYENAENSKELLKSKGLWGGEVVLFTSAFHMRRARSVFEKSGYQVLAFPTSMRTHKINWLNPSHYLNPSLDSWNRWNLLLHEWVGYFTYKLLGYC